MKIKVNTDGTITITMKEGVESLDELEWVARKIARLIDLDQHSNPAPFFPDIRVEVTV